MTLKTFVMINYSFDGVLVKVRKIQKVIMHIELMIIECGTAWFVFPDIGVVGSGQS